MIALVGALVGLRAGYRYDRSINRHPMRSGVKRLVFWLLLLLVECLTVPSAFASAGPLIGPLVFGYVLAVGLIGPWVAEYYRRRSA
ncbi:hypothetical protein [Saccharothrix syringae]|uniref:Uncharacterized protein n=1 Tax=Saccharothrix syringae TaxID=103733 RepID=A0A5Q0HAD5_SACSY|nr:hypothetical protein [Saccharothrix syringae]QFZ22612.1 hypothetical protein EKG83_38940 [Saccharothrix syringae]